MLRSTLFSSPIALYVCAAFGAILLFGGDVRTQTTVDMDALSREFRPVCSNQTLRGKFAFKGDGLVPSGPPPATGTFQRGWPAHTGWRRQSHECLNS